MQGGYLHEKALFGTVGYDPDGSAAFAEEGKAETFSAEYEMAVTTSSGQPKNDTFIFEGGTHG